MKGSRLCPFKLRRFGIELVGSSLVLALDQASKSFMIELLSDPQRVIPVTPFFNLSLGFNRGVSVGLLNDLGTWGPTILSSLAMAIIGFLLVWLWKAENKIEGSAIALIIGGALGNLVDRVRAGAVTDFLDFFIGVYHWPAFNVADTSIFLGAGLLVFQSLCNNRKTKQVEQENADKK